MQSFEQQLKWPAALLAQGSFHPSKWGKVRSFDASKKPKITSKRGCQIKRRCGRHIVPLAHLVLIAYGNRCTPLSRLLWGQIPLACRPGLPSLWSRSGSPSQLPRVCAGPVAPRGPAMSFRFFAFDAVLGQHPCGYGSPPPARPPRPRPRRPRDEATVGTRFLLFLLIMSAHRFREFLAFGTWCLLMGALVMATIVDSGVGEVPPSPSGVSVTTQPHRGGGGGGATPPPPNRPPLK